MKRVNDHLNASLIAFPRGHLPLSAVLVGANLLLVAPQAHAAHWEMTWRPEGTGSVVGGSSYDWEWVEAYRYRTDYNTSTGRVPAPVQFGNNTGGQASSQQSGSDRVHSATKAAQEGHIVIHLKWVQDPGDTPPVPTPKMVCLRFTGSASATASSLSSQISAKAHFGKREGDDTSGSYVWSGNTISWYDSSTSADVQGDSQHKQIDVPIVVPDGQSEVEYLFPLGASANTQQVVSDSDTAPASISGLSIQAEITPLAVAIDSDIEESWYKWSGAASDLPIAYKTRDSSGELLNQPNDKAIQVLGQNTPNDSSDDVWKLMCLVSPNGTMTVESAAQWVTSSNPQFKAWLGGAHFTAHTVGFLDPTTYDWTAPAQAHRHNIGGSPEVYNLHVDAPTTSVPYFGIKLGDKEEGSDLVKSSTLTVKAINPNLELSNSYTVNWHLPRENWTQYGPTTAIFHNPPVEMAAPGYAIMNGGINVSYLPSGDYWGEATNTAIGDMLAVAGNLLPAPYSGFAAAAGLTAGDSERISVPVTFNDNWGTSDATYVPNRDDSAKEFYHMTVQRSVGYNIKFWKGDCYDQHGYTGEEKKATATLNGAEKWVATFVRQNGESGTPGANG